ncbi:MAG: hyalin domain-containing, partial [Prolixibacteraceae bacterium]
DNFVFNTVTCVWDNTGTKPAEPTNLECWETAVFDNTTCKWAVTGDKPAAPTIISDGEATFCTGESVTLTSSEGFEYLWSTGENTRSIKVNTSGSYWVKIYDESGCESEQSESMVIDVIQPSLLQIYAVNVNPTVPVAIGTLIQLNATFINNYPVDVTIDWGDGISTLFGDETDGTVITNHVYSEAGVYSVTIVLKDKCKNTVNAGYNYVVVYDPSAGFVTGGGWIISPAGAYVADPTLTGKANFGFVSKYQKGKAVPTGQTEFQFHAAGMNFKSTDYEWLVIAGKKAQFKGSGTINGSGNYGFILTATDDIPDRFRIKIWHNSTGKIVYDNQIGSPDNANPSTSIGGGSIVIHNAKTKSAEISEINSVAEMLNITVYPNPFTDRLRFEFVSPADVNAQIDLFDMNGRLVKTIFEQQVEADQYYEAEFKPETTISAFYVYRIILGENVQNGKVIFKKE